MTQAERQVTGLDLGTSKGTCIHAGVVFDGHLDVELLRQSAEKLVDAYPELQVAVKRKLFSLGQFVTPSVHDASTCWDFKTRDWGERSLTDIFPPAAYAANNSTSSDKVTHLGTVNSEELDNLFTFDTPSILMLGVKASPVLMFRVTTLGSKESGHTVLGLCAPHIVVDGQAVAGLLEAWGNLYRGEVIPKRVDEPHPDLVSILSNVDSVDESKDVASPESQLRPGLMDALSYVKDSYLNSSKGTEEHYFHVPRPILESLRDEARSIQGATNNLPVSKMDVFCGLILKLCAHSSLAAEGKPFDFYYAYEFSRVFPEGSIPTPYLHNFHAFGRFPFLSTSEIISDSLPRLAIAIRTRLNLLRTPYNIRQQLLFHEQHKDSFVLVPRWDRNHGWGMVSSWEDVEKRVRAGFAGEKLVFVRPRVQFPFDLSVPNIAIPFGDGNGGLWVRMTTPKGDWETMWQKSGVDELV